MTPPDARAIAEHVTAWFESPFHTHIGLTREEAATLARAYLELLDELKEWQQAAHSLARDVGNDFEAPDAD